MGWSGAYKQLPVLECLKLYNHEVYKQMGYYEAFENSKNELIQRDEKNEIKFASKFFDLTKSQLSLYAVNHPTKDVINELGKSICNYINVTPLDSHGFFYDSLVESTIWPLYPEIINYHQLPYDASYLFYPHLNNGIKPLNLEQFIVESYNAYEKLGYDRFMSIELATVLKNIDLSY